MVNNVEKKAGINMFTISAILTLVGAFLVMTINGFAYAWGNIVIYVVGHLRDVGNNVFAYEFYIVFPLMLITTTVFMPLGMKVSIIYPSYIAIFCGAFFQIGSIYLSSYINSPVLFIIVFAVGFGIGKSFTYSCAFHSATSHLKGKKGLVSGIVVSALGVGGFIYSQIP